MRRTIPSIKPPKRKADAILTADIHMTESPPISRTDDYLAAQERKLKYLARMREAHGNCPILDAGDLFHHWKPSPWLLNRTLRLLPNQLITIAGNHDLPEHSILLYDKSGLAVLERAGRVIVLKDPNVSMQCSASIHVTGMPADLYSRSKAVTTEWGARNILLMHEMVWPTTGRPPWPDAVGHTAKQVLKDNPTFDLIVTGDNHSAFVEKYKGRVLVNPGSMMRISADKAKYKPRFYLYYADENGVKPVYYPIQEGVHDRSHIDRVKEKKSRIEAYIERMNMEWQVELSFKANLKRFFKKNKTPKRIKELIYTAMEED